MTKMLQIFSAFLVLVWWIFVAIVFMVFAWCFIWNHLL